MVNLEWYRTFKEIYERGTLTKASVALYASQPGVSVHLKALETYVGKTLFERTSRKMVPTEDGKVLYEFIVEAINKLEVAEQHFKKTTQEKSPSVHIGMCSETFQLIIEPEVHKLDFDLVARFGAHPDLISDLDNGILDLVITPEPQRKQKTLVEYTPFSRERIVLIAGAKTDTKETERCLKNSDFKGLKEELLKNTWYSSSNEMEHFRRFWFENFNERAAFKPNYILPSITSIIRCLSQGNGLALVPDFLCQEQIAAKEIKLVWEGRVSTENILYFGSRTDLKYKRELAVIQDIFRSKMRGAED
ncbi:LysR family transcriptional regulator [Neolewinella aurantiaca]|uniref:LysR family transcriptional regulator n=1 Tax=Neolewinella aurantiaca TaxID=2602767 RepID=A0A5C7FML3_9BACT|nr:LysR family transcriptional regulator [Neolewinella aurantiaca]TXF87624.1 LysR family transcriptional regulator [Neolewinella aurantiaca]